LLLLNVSGMTNIYKSENMICQSAFIAVIRLSRLCGNRIEADSVLDVS
jgi:hypothetical protein